MTKSQHTPAPWKAHFGIKGGHRGIGITTESTEFDGEGAPYHPLIAGVYRGYGHAPIDIAMANANLIAAAPELLEALEGLLKAPKTIEKEAKALAALEKAKGGAA